MDGEYDTHALTSHSKLLTISCKLLYIVADAFIGIVPFVGDVLDVAFKANIYNLRLLEKELKKGRYATVVRNLFKRRLIQLIVVQIIFPAPGDWLPKPKESKPYSRWRWN